MGFSMKNSTKELVEFICKGDRCAKEGTTTARKNGKYYLATGKQKYSLDSNKDSNFQGVLRVKGFLTLN